MAAQLAFYKGTRAENSHALLFDRAVCAWPRSAGRFSHVELVVDGICWSSSFRDGGVRGKKVDLTTGRWVMASIEGDELAARDWFTEHLNKPYDVLGLFGFVLPWRTDNPQAWFCSEAVAASLGLAKPWTISPNELFSMCTVMP